MSIGRAALRLLITFAFGAVAFAAGSDQGKPVHIKGYVLDSACAFTKEDRKSVV